MSTTTPIPATMQAAVLLDGRPGLQLLQIPTPTPLPGEALVEVTACGVCHTDLHVIKNEVAFPRPAVLGHEISGRIVAVGDDTTAADAGLGIGDAVVSGFIMPCTSCDACTRGRDDLCERFFGMNRLRGTLYDGTSRLRMPDGSFLAMYSMGGLAEYAVVPVAALAGIPAKVSEVAACLLGCAGLTAYGATHRAGNVQPGHTAAIIGVGGVGASLIPMLRAAGAVQVIAIDIADGKLDLARRLGATATVNAARDEPVDAVRALTAGGVDIAFEALGRPATFRQATAMLGDGGRMVAIGIAATGQTAEVEITPLVRRGHQIVGSFGGRTRTDLPRVVELAATGRFDPATLISRTFPLEDADAAYQALAAGDILGRAVVTMPNLQEPSRKDTL